MTDRGTAYQLWALVEDERLTRGWTGVKMSEYLGLPRNTIANLAVSPNKPRIGTVHTIADKLGVDRREAEVLAGLRPGPRSAGAVSAVEAIRLDTVFTPEEKQILIDLAEMFARRRQVDDQDDGPVSAVG